jgi:hypothetical protein
MQTLDLQDVLQRRSGITETTIGHEVILSSLEHGRYIGLNRTALAIWHTLDGQKNIHDIVQVLCQRFAVGEADCRTATLRTLDDLARQGLVEWVI